MFELGLPGTIVLYDFPEPTYLSANLLFSLGVYFELSEDRLRKTQFIFQKKRKSLQGNLKMGRGDVDYTICLSTV